MRIIIKTERTISDSDFDAYLRALSTTELPSHVIESLRNEKFAIWESPGVKTVYEVKP